MRLVIIAAIECELLPMRIRATMERLHSDLEAVDATPELGGEAGVFADELV
jgi:hypothetical protein